MSSCATSSSGAWTAAVHLSDPAFTSRVDFADAYVLPTTTSSPTASENTSTVTAPQAAVVSPWLLFPSTTPSSSASIETVPLAWRCPSCGTLEIEQLYWRRPPRQMALPGRENAPTSAADVRASLARRLRLQGLSPAMKAKLERHRRRRERREEMRWRSMQVSTRCRQCFLCPRCGGQGGTPSLALDAKAPCDPSTNEKLSSALSSSETKAFADHVAAFRIRNSATYPSSSFSASPSGMPSVSALDIRLTREMRYFAVCPCCHWHSYQAFSSMEQLLSYLETTMGEDKAEAMRDWRTAQRSGNNALRKRLTNDVFVLNAKSSANGSVSTAEEAGYEVLQQQQQPKPTVSQAAWDTYRAITTAALRRHSSPSSPRGDAPAVPSRPSRRSRNDEGDGETEEALMTTLHPAVALEQLRVRETARRASAAPDRQSICAPAGAVQVMQVMDLAQEAWAYLQNIDDEDDDDASKAYGNQHLTEGTAAALSVSRPFSSEVQQIVATQRSIMGLGAEAVDTRALTVQEWVRRYQPAAVVAQQRKAALTASTDAAAAPSVTTKGVTSTSFVASPPRAAVNPSFGGSPSTSLTDKTPAKLLETPLHPAFKTPLPFVKRAAGVAHATPPATTAVDAALTTPAAAAAAAAAAAGGGGVCGQATPAAAATAVSALYHTPTSAYLQSLLQREEDHPLGLPAYCVPRGRKELLTGLVWRLPAENEEDSNSYNSHNNNNSATTVDVEGCRVPCTRVVLLDRPAVADAEVRAVMEHWVEQLKKQAGRHREAQREQQPPQPQSLPSFVEKSVGRDAAADDGGSNSEADEEDLLEMLGTDDPQRTRADPINKHARDKMRLASPATSGATSAGTETQRVTALRKKRRTALPMPLFLNGAGFAAVGVLPFWEYAGCTSALSSASAVEMTQWHFRVVNVNLQHSVCVTKLEVKGVSCQGNASMRRSNSTAPSVATADTSSAPQPSLASQLQLSMSATSVPVVQLPCVLTPACTPEEQLAFYMHDTATITKAAASAEEEKTGEAGNRMEVFDEGGGSAAESSDDGEASTPTSAAASSRRIPLSLRKLLSQEAAKTLFSVSELEVTIQLPSSCLYDERWSNELRPAEKSTLSASPSRLPKVSSLYVALTVEVLTALPNVAALASSLSTSSTAASSGQISKSEYYTVTYGISVLLNVT